MPTTYTDQFFTIDPGNPPPVGTALTTASYDLIDANDNGRINPNTADTFNGIGITAVWRNDTITVVMRGETVTITGTTFYLATGPAVFTPTDGTILANATFVSSTWVTTSSFLPVGGLGPPCFTPGTLILTPSGLCLIEDLQVGDLVMTRDDGPQPLRWLGQCEVAGHGDWAPIRFAPGALGNDRALIVSPQHRMLITGWKAELYFGEAEVLVAARHLVNDMTIRRAPQSRVTYVHLLFDRHQVIWAEGAAPESLFLGDAVRASNPDLMDEVTALFPDLAFPDGDWKTARPTARQYEARLMA
jgi:hypothetical protein